MLNLLEFDDKVCSNMSWLLVTHLLENKLSTLAKARLDLYLLCCANRMDRLRIVVNYIALVVNSFQRTVVKLLESAVDCQCDVLRFILLGLSQSA